MKKGDNILNSDSIKNTKIYNFSNKQVGIVDSVVWDINKENIDGLIYFKNLIIQNKGFIKFLDIELIEKDKIVLKKNYRPNKIPKMVEPHESKVLDKNDVEIGYISEFWIEEKSGSVKKIEIANNIYDDLKFGRKKYKLFCSTSKGIKIL